MEILKVKLMDMMMDLMKVIQTDVTMDYKMGSRLEIHLGEN